jgi:curli biogenesis system outer membrane secretion channel CsgG
MKRFSTLFFTAIFLVLFFAACTTTETRRAVEAPQSAAAHRPYSGPRAPIIVANVDNRSGFGQGIFTSGDPMGSQAKTILITHLSQTNRFAVLDRANMDEARREAEIRGEAQQLMGASYVITGDVSEFGRREVNTYALFGILGRGRQQLAYSRVNLYVVDIRSSAVVLSVSGAGETTLSDMEVIGFGTSASYDSTLNGKVLDLAIREAVDRLAEAIDSGAWRPMGI